MLERVAANISVAESDLCIDARERPSLTTNEVHYTRENKTRNVYTRSKKNIAVSIARNDDIYLGT